MSGSVSVTSSWNRKVPPDDGDREVGEAHCGAGQAQPLGSQGRQLARALPPHPREAGQSKQRTGAGHGYHDAEVSA